MTDFSYGSGGRQEPGGDGYAPGAGPWNSEQGPQGGAPYSQFGQGQAPFGQQQPFGYDGAPASNVMPGAPNVPSQPSAPDAAGQQAFGDYDYAPSVTPGFSSPSSQPPGGGPFGDPYQADGMGYGGAGYPPGGMYGGAFQQPGRRVSPAIIVVAVIAVIGVVIGTLWATGVFGKGRHDVDPTPSITTTDPSDDDTTDSSDDDTTDPSDDDTTDPSDDDTTQSNDPQDPLGQIGYQIKPVTKQGDTYTLQDTTVQVLEYKADAREQVKAVNSRDYRDDETYVGVKIRLTNNGSQRTYPFEYRFYVGDPSSSNLMFEVEDSSQGALASSSYVEVGKPIEGWVYFGAVEPPNAGKMKLYVRTPSDRYPKKVAYRCEEPIG